MVINPGQHQTQHTTRSSLALSAGLDIGPICSAPMRGHRDIFGRVSPGLEELMQWMRDNQARRMEIPANSASVERNQDTKDAQSLSENDARTTSSTHRLVKVRAQPNMQSELDALVNSTAIKNAVQVQPLGYRPGVMGGRVGLLEGLRTPDMDKYDQKRRAPPTDLSGLTAEDIVERHNRMAREYSLVAHERRGAAEAMLERDAAALRFAQNVMEHAPGIAYLTLSADMRGLILYANRGGEKVVGVVPADLLGRPFPEFVHSDDRAAFYQCLAVLVLSKNPDYSSSLRFRVGTTAAGSQSVDARFRFGALGVACSLRMMT